MKRMLCMLLAALMLLPACALAQETLSTANGVVESAQTWELTAPYSGVLKPFDWERGDAVRAADAVFTLETTKLYAPESGTLAALFVAEGELCDDAALQYGMVAAIEKERPLMLDASTKGAYNSAENKVLHLGATAYYELSNGDEKGEGRITSITGNDFIVEMDASGEFDPGDTVKIYRDEQRGTKTCIGQGTVRRAADIRVNASGRVLKLHAQQGDKVQKGELLMELAPADAEPTVKSADVLAGHDGALLAISVAQGQQVYRGQSLATVADLSRLNVVAEVDEIDLSHISIGDTLKVVLDRYPDNELSATVSAISRVGAPKQNAAYFDVELALTTGLEVLPGMNATVYIPTGD